MELDEQQREHARLPPVVLVGVFVTLLALGLAVRVPRLDSPNFAFAAARQFDSAITARGFYLDMGGNVDGIDDQRAAVLDDRLGRQEAPVLPVVAAISYRAVGGEHIWIPRLLGVLGWLVGALAVGLIARRMAGDIAACFALGFALLAPFGVATSRSFQPDALMVSAIFVAWLLILRWDEQRSGRRLLAAAAVAALAVFLKPVAVLFVMGVFGGVMLRRVGVVGTLRNRNTWAFLATTLAPLFAYRVVMRTAGTDVGTSTQGYFVPSLFGRAHFYSDFINQVDAVTGLAVAIIAVASLVLLTRSTARASVLGFLAGAVAYTIAFNYHASTHTYYELYLVALCALGLGILAQFIVDDTRRRVGSSRTGIAIVVVGLALALLVAPAVRERSSVEDSLPLASTAMGAAVDHGERAVILAPDSGNPHEYYGAFSAWVWPNHGDLAAAEAAGETVPPTKQRFDELRADSDFFVVAWPEELAIQPELANILDGYPVRASGDGWTVYDLRDR